MVTPPALVSGLLPGESIWSDHVSEARDNGHSSVSDAHNWKKVRGFRLQEIFAGKHHWIRNFQIDFSGEKRRPSDHSALQPQFSRPVLITDGSAKQRNLSDVSGRHVRQAVV